MAETGYVDPNSPLHECAQRWISVVDVQDSNYVAISTEPGRVGEAIDCFHETVGEPGYNKIVAKSFTDLLAGLLRSPEAFWLGDGSPDYGYH